MVFVTLKLQQPSGCQTPAADTDRQLTAEFLDGGWFPLLCGIALFVALTTWKRAEAILASHESRHRIRVSDFAQWVGADIPRVPGNAIYLSPDAGYLPTVFLHNLKHYKVVHERIMFLTIVDADVPRIPDADRTELNIIEPGRVYQVSMLYGFMEEPDVQAGLRLLEKRCGKGLAFDSAATTFFLGKTTVARAAKPGLYNWRRELFRWIQRNSPATAEYFNLVPSRVVELGTQLTI